MSAVADKLREAKALVAQGWVQLQCVTNSNGEACSYDEATCFCSFGAIAALTQDSFDLRQKMLDTIETALGDVTITVWNDAPGRTQPEVLAAFDKAIELAEAQS